MPPINIAGLTKNQILYDLDSLTKTNQRGKAKSKEYCFYGICCINESLRNSPFLRSCLKEHLSKSDKLQIDLASYINSDTEEFLKKLHFALFKKDITKKELKKYLEYSALGINKELLAYLICTSKVVESSLALDGIDVCEQAYLDFTDANKKSSGLKNIKEFVQMPKKMEEIQTRLYAVELKSEGISDLAVAYKKLYNRGGEV